jgi:PTH1 family peptidyl-tRNA hydrolase
MMLERMAKAHDFDQFEKSKKVKGLVSEGKIGKEKVVLLMPETFMNKSGEAVKPFVKSAKDAERTIVVYDDLDLPFGKFKISYGKNSGGHRGMESIIKSLKTKDFVRVRVGISPMTPGGKLKKPSGEKPVLDFILGKFKPAEIDELKKEGKKIVEAIEMIVSEGRAAAMMEFN